MLNSDSDNNDDMVSSEHQKTEKSNRNRRFLMRIDIDRSWRESSSSFTDLSDDDDDDKPSCSSLLSHQERQDICKQKAKCYSNSTNNKEKNQAINEVNNTVLY